VKARSRIATASSRSGLARSRRRGAAFALAIAALSLLAFAPLSQAKLVVSGFGTSGPSTSFGGQFSNLSGGGLAVNTSGVGAPAGTVYVVDGYGRRVQRFGPGGDFQRLWGQNVVAPAVNDTQRIVVEASDGTFTLTFNGATTDPIAYEEKESPLEKEEANQALGQDIRHALAELPSVGGSANLRVSNLPVEAVFYVEFVGALGAADQPQITADADRLSGTVEISTLADGDSTTADTGTGFEICTASHECQTGATTGSNEAVAGTTANGGQLGEPQGIAVDQATGNVYVTDQRNNNQGDRRVTEFDADGHFLRAWGWDVVRSGMTGDVPGTNEVQEVTLGANTIGGTFVLGQAGSYIEGHTTAPIAWDASPAEVQSALEEVVTIGSGNVSVSSPNPGGGTIGGPYTIEFSGARADADVETLEPEAGGLAVSSGSKTVAVSTVTRGAPGGFEICTAEADCKTAAKAGADGGRFGNQMGYPVVDSSGNVWVPDPSNRRIQEFDSSGNFIAAFGYNVDALGGSGGLEECTSTAPGACQAGTAGSGAGQFAGSDPSQIAFDSSGNLYAIDNGNHRVQKFDPTLLASATSFGAAALSSYTTAAPSKIAATAGGNRLAFAVTNNVSGGGEQQIVEIGTGDESVKDTSLVGGGITAEIGGIADDGDGGLLATVAFGGPRHVLVLGDTLPPAPTLTPKPVVTKSDTTAVLSANVDPAGGLVSCKFQYSTDLSDWTDVPAPGCESFAATGVQGVSHGVIGLAPNTHYFFRLQASRPLVPNSAVTSSVQSFDTDSVPPVVTNVGAIQVADTSARLVGTIDPRHSATGYVFEYGTTPSLGSSTAPLAIGDGTAPIVVSQLVTGLAKDTTYYYELVATNAFGSTSSDQRTLHTRAVPFPPAGSGICANEAVRDEQSATFLPDCRAYEMVSPPDKNQGDVTIGQGAIIHGNFSADGTAVAFCATSVFGEPAGEMTNFCAPYISRRGADGWSTGSPLPRYCRLNLGEEGSGANGTALLSPRSFDRAAISLPEFTSCPIPSLDAAAERGKLNMYREDMRTDPFSYQLIAPHGAAISEGQALPLAGSEDLSHVVYGSRFDQTPDSPPGEDFGKLFEWEEAGQGACVQPGGCLSLVSVDPAGNPFETPSFFPEHHIGGSPVPLASAVSADGERVYFNSGPGIPAGAGCSESSCWANGCSNAEAECDLYLREGGPAGDTFRVSESECNVDCGGYSSRAQFLWATSAGDKAFFESCSKLTDASSETTDACRVLATPSAPNLLKLYRWDRSAPPGHRLVDLTVDHEPADSTQPEAVDLIGASTDKNADPESNAAPGNTVYFVAGGQLVSGEPAPVKGLDTPIGLKLYRWRWNEGSPSLDYLGPYRSTWDNGYSENNTGGFDNVDDDPNANRIHIRVTPDGRYLVIQTRLALDPVADQDTDSDLYRWDEAGGWLCISCQPPAAPSAGAVSTFTPSIPYYSAVNNELGGDVPEHTISDDGRRIFFTTPDALVPQDVDGETGCPTVGHPDDFFFAYSCADVYEWHDGTISLLSSGTGRAASILLGATNTGEDVFYATPQRLLGRDADNGYDIYDVHAGGGFPEPAAQPPGCEGEACRGEGSVPANVPGAGTAVFEGPGNQSRDLTPRPRHCRRGFAKRHGKCVRKRQSKRHHRRAANHKRRAGR
jgi:NHL repeat-containing protein